jgi:hypothetical protein
MPKDGFALRAAAAVQSGISECALVELAMSSKIRRYYEQQTTHGFIPFYSIEDARRAGELMKTW